MTNPDGLDYERPYVLLCEEEPFYLDRISQIVIATLPEIAVFGSQYHNQMRGILQEVLSRNATSMLVGCVFDKNCTQMVNGFPQPQRNSGVILARHVKSMNPEVPVIIETDGNTIDDEPSVDVCIEKLDLRVSLPKEIQRLFIPRISRMRNI